MQRETKNHQFAILIGQEYQREDNHGFKKGLLLQNLKIDSLFTNHSLLRTASELGTRQKTSVSVFLVADSKFDKKLCLLVR